MIGQEDRTNQILALNKTALSLELKQLIPESSSTELYLITALREALKLFQGTKMKDCDICKEMGALLERPLLTEYTPEQSYKLMTQTKEVGRNDHYLLLEIQKPTLCKSEKLVMLLEEVQSNLVDNGFALTQCPQTPTD